VKTAAKEADLARQSLANMVSEDLLNRILRGEFAPDASLPGEIELTVHHEVSRLTVREAIKTLEAQGVIRVERGRGTFVNPVTRWSSMEAVLRASLDTDHEAATSIQLIELRRILETGAAELAAPRMTDDDLIAIRSQLDIMSATHATNNVSDFVEADLAFHDVILRASGNVFLAVMFEPLSAVLTTRRVETSRVAVIQANAITAHADIVEALSARDGESARQAMERHMTQTLEDLKLYVLRDSDG
jgi:GntR family transcriptional repressor for pyruvate dehydrogenase complex